MTSTRVRGLLLRLGRAIHGTDRRQQREAMQQRQHALRQAYRESDRLAAALVIAGLTRREK